MNKVLTLVVLNVFVFTTVLSAQTAPVPQQDISKAVAPTVKIAPYTKGQIPDWAKDLRRAEIVSLGSLPFTTLTVTLSYSLIRYFKNGMDQNYIPNPFAKTSSAAQLDTDEQIGIIATAASISLLVGITDLIIMAVKRQQIKKTQEKDAIIDPLNPPTILVVPESMQDTTTIDTVIDVPTEKLPETLSEIPKEEQL